MMKIREDRDIQMIIEGQGITKAGIDEIKEMNKRATVRHVGRKITKEDTEDVPLVERNVFAAVVEDT